LVPFPSAYVGEFMTGTPMSTPPDPSVAFRRKSTWLFRAFMVVLGVLAVGLAVLGWWIGSWWGLAVGVVVGALVFVGGAVAGTLLWAMSQDGG
jgi:hypothetical protein